MDSLAAATARAAAGVLRRAAEGLEASAVVRRRRPGAAGGQWLRCRCTPVPSACKAGGRSRRSLRSARGRFGPPLPRPRGRAYADPILAQADLELEAHALGSQDFAPDPVVDFEALATALTDPTTPSFRFFLDGSANYWAAARALAWTPARLWRAM